jgi:putative membrane protein
LWIVSRLIEILLIALPAVWYAVGVRALWRRAGVGHGVSRNQTVAFACAMIVLAIALLSPLDEMADQLFSAHMVQHLLLILIAAPLCVLGAPLVPALWAFSPARRRRLGRWWCGATRLRHAVHTMTQPGVVFVLHMTLLWFWHFPAPYRVALEHEGVHAMEHLSFFGSAALFWWVVAQPTGRRRASEPVSLLLVFGTLMHSGALGAVLMFAPVPWYPIHAAGVHAWGTTLIEDQQLAGLLMWIPAGAVYVAAAAWLFLRWMRADERRSMLRTTAPRIVPGTPAQGAR